MGIATYSPHDDRIVGLATLFAMLYFIQGISEPTEGLLAQPTRSLLRNWGYATDSVATFMAALAVPWSIKPVYGLLTDFVPLGGTRRRSWLLLTSLVTSVGLIALYAFAPPAGFAWLLLAWLMVPAIGVAFSDVVVDALMVEEGQPRGLTGRLQSVQWAAIYAATILTGTLGGFLSQQKQQELGFLIAGLATAVSFLLVLIIVREPHRREASTTLGPPKKASIRDALLALWRTVRHPGILAIGAFIFLWNFNPFSTTVLYMHMVKHMGFSEQFYGNTVSIQAVASVFASVAYGFYCRRLSVTQLINLSIVTGVLATIGYWALAGVWSARIISFAVGFVYMTALLVQLDLAARVCEIATAGTTFALLMSLSNFSMGLSAALGGYVYEGIAGGKNYAFAFQVVVGIGALFTCCCWFLAPVIRRHCEPKSHAALP
jgi:Na+/melibiose symporter-like transporter